MYIHIRTCKYKIVGLFRYRKSSEVATPMTPSDFIFFRSSSESIFSLQYGQVSGRGIGGTLRMYCSTIAVSITVV